MIGETKLIELLTPFLQESKNQLYINSEYAQEGQKPRSGAQNCYMTFKENQATQLPTTPWKERNVFSWRSTLPDWVYFTIFGLFSKAWFCGEYGTNAMRRYLTILLALYIQLLAEYGYACRTMPSWLGSKFLKELRLKLLGFGIKSLTVVAEVTRVFVIVNCPKK